MRILTGISVLLFTGLIFFTPASLFAQKMEDNYRIYSVKLDREVTLAEISEEMKNYDVLFFGEEHNDSIIHYLENKMFETLFQQYGANLTLSLEMFDRDVQTIMNEYLADKIRERNFIKDARVWSNYKDYRPMVEFAKAHQLPVICANASSRYTNLAGRMGQQALLDLTKESKQNFAPLPYAAATGKYLEKLQEVMGHATPAKTDTAVKAPTVMPSMEDFDFIVSQSLWDATMAYSIAEFLKKNKGKKVMQVNGKFHSDERFAIVTQLQQYRPKAKSLVISAGSDDSFPNIKWSDQKHLGDYIIITDPAIKKTF